MTTGVTMVQEVSLAVIPAGTYQGIWGGYKVTVGKWIITTEDGVRGFNIPCTVHVTVGGKVTVKTNK